MGTAVPAHAADSFQYDPIGRLTQVTYSDGGILAYTYDGVGNILSIVASLATTGVEEGAPEAYRFALGRMTPNPGSGPRSITFSIPAEGNASLRVYDIQGRLVATLFDRDIPAGRYSAQFPSERLASGVYFFRLTHGGRSLTQRMVLIR